MGEVRVVLGIVCSTVCGPGAASADASATVCRCIAKS